MYSTEHSAALPKWQLRAHPDSGTGGHVPTPMYQPPYPRTLSIVGSSQVQAALGEM
jgi:hypothetical protein